MATTERQVDVTAPLEQMSGSAPSRPVGKVELPSSLLERISKAATSLVDPATGKVDVGSTPAAPATPAKPVTPTPPATVTTTEKATQPPAGTAPAKVDPKPKQEGIAAVREALERREAELEILKASGLATNKQLADAHAKVAEFEGKVKGYEERFQKEYEPQLRKLTEREKRLNEVEEQLKLIDYTRTPEFHDRNIKPIAEAQRDVEDLLKQVAVYDADGKPSAATLQHFSAVLAAPTLNEGEKIAKQLFGEGFATTELVRQSARIRSLQRGLKEAQEKAALDSAEYHKRQQDTQMADQARFRQAVEQRVNNYVVKPLEDDPEEMAAVSEGQKFAELIKQGVPDLEQRAELTARILANATSDKLKDLRLKRLTDELTTTKAELAKYQKSEPDVETRRTGATSQATIAEKGSLHEKLMEAARKAIKR